MTPIVRLLHVCRQISTGLHGAAFAAAALTTTIVYHEIKSGDRLPSQIVGIGIVGGLCVLILACFARRLESACRSVRQEGAANP
jgi:hypothetical protein